MMTTTKSGPWIELWVSRRGDPGGRGEKGELVRPAGRGQLAGGLELVCVSNNMIPNPGLTLTQKKSPEEYGGQGATCQIEGGVRETAGGIQVRLNGYPLP